jgi:predicted YcjX-like family ATPase
LAKLTRLSDDALLAIDNLTDLATGIVSPTLRFGVTGLSRAGKTVFITALVHNLVRGGRLPLFEAHASGRISGAALKPQPSMHVPRFQYEDHVKTLVGKRQWPQSTRAISELRLTVNFESASAWSRAFGAGKLNIDIVDYPGEWLLDLPLLAMSFEEWSALALALSRLPNRAKLAKAWHAKLKAHDPSAPADEQVAAELAQAFTAYLAACREDENALSTLPPGRFLMPGDLEGSPALTFCPLDMDGVTASRGSLARMMADRYEAYKDVVVRPFFRDHFARLDRQIVLVDALQAINAGPAAVADLETALTEILSCFRPGRASLLSPLIGRRIDRILFAATKADHLHHENHDRLEAVLSHLVDSAMARARFAGAKVEVLAIAAVRATHEALMQERGDSLPVIVGTPLAGETMDGETFDGRTETAIFPGDLPADPAKLLSGEGKKPDLRFIRFKPPRLETTADGLELSLPHIRLDRALQFLFGDKLA